MSASVWSRSCTDGRRIPAVEVLINTPMIRDLLRRGQVHEIKAGDGRKRWRKAWSPSTSACSA